MRFLPDLRRWLPRLPTLNPAAPPTLSPMLRQLNDEFTLTENVNGAFSPDEALDEDPTEEAPTAPLSVVYAGRARRGVHPPDRLVLMAVLAFASVLTAAVAGGVWLEAGDLPPGAVAALPVSGLLTLAAIGLAVVR